MHTYTTSTSYPSCVDAGVNNSLPPSPPKFLFLENSILIDTFSPDFTDDPFINRPALGPLELAKIKKAQKKAEQRMLRERRKSRYFYPSTPTRKLVTVSGPPPLEYKSARAKASAAWFANITQDSLQDLADLWTLKMAAAAFY